ncbi:MAG: redox-regulated ATPase YchF [Spirochaetales bacterium]|nr:redox-regulated ATPase YchF [Spirochaetales bacterium]
MSLNCGIVGLPNVGKSTIFSALTSAPAEAANYPFSTIQPNVGIVSVPDERLDKIVELIPPKKVIPAVVEFVDIAGLARGASTGEGLGNRFLAQIREVGIIVHVVRCFENDDITHVDSTINPESDIETIQIELALADLETVEKRLVKLDKLSRMGKEGANQAAQLLPLLTSLKDALEQGIPARSLDFTQEQKLKVRDLHLLTMKPQIYVCNVDENGLGENNSLVMKVRKVAGEEGSHVLVICGLLEAEIATLDSREERSEFLKEAGLEESGLNRLIKTAYDTLGLRTFFTTGPDEDRAWTFHEGDTAPQTAGVIHTDFQKGFIKAAVYHCTDLFELSSEQKIKTAGRLRIEGKEYLVRDGDIMHFRFNV